MNQLTRTKNGEILPELVESHAAKSNKPGYKGGYNGAASDGRIRATRAKTSELARDGVAELLARRMRTVLAALGIGIGVAALIAVVGVSNSSKASALAELDKLGTNLLVVKPGQTFTGKAARLPEAAPARIRRIGPVLNVATTSSTEASILRNDRIPKLETGGISVSTASLGLLDLLGTGMKKGRFLDASTQSYPTTVLGSVAAERLGIDSIGTQVWLSNQWFTVIGIMNVATLVPDIDRTALIGIPAAKTILGARINPTEIYVRGVPTEISALREVLPRTTNQENPEEVDVSRPSDALAARGVIDKTLTKLLLGLGAISLLVGGIGIANTMLVTVLQRQGEIGLRRAIGATQGQIRTQFLIESALLSTLGGIGGVALGSAAVFAITRFQSWPYQFPPNIAAGGVAAAAALGLVAGFIPARRAASLPPTVALQAT
jgi:ABC-type antimicrobial peptide transport system permease subunit